MDAKQKQAIDRIHQALDGKDVENHRCESGLDEDGNPIHGTRTPWVDVNTDDIVLVCDAVPISKVNEHVRVQRLGARRAGPDRVVGKQTQCLWELLRLATGLTAGTPYVPPATPEVQASAPVPESE